MTYKVGIDLGGTNIRAALIDGEGNVVSQFEETTEAEKGPDFTIQKMIILTKKVVDGREISGIGIGAPGPLDPEKGVILSPPNLPGWDRIELVRLLQDHFQVKVALNNDANAAAVAEALMGSGKGFKTVFYITVSTGIGGGFVVNGKIFNGASGYASEIANMIVQPNGYQHSNLNRGSLEGYASGTAIGRKAAEAGITGGASEVFNLAKSGNEQALSIIEEAVNYLAIGIANIAHTVNPDVFVLGGGVMKNADLLLPLLKKKVKEYLYPGLAETLNIVAASLGGKTGVLGAAMLIEQ